MENSATARLRATAFAAAICLAGTSPPASRADDDLSGWLLASAFAPLPGDAAIHRYPELAHLSPGALSSVASLPGGPSRASRGPRPEVVRRKSPFFSLSFEEFDDLLRDVETRHLEFILSLEDTESDESFSFAVPRSLSPSVGVASRFEARLDVSESFRRRGDVYSIDTRMNSRGSLQNIAGSRWRVDGSGTFRYRDGAVPWELTEGEEPRFDLHEISALRRFDGGSVRFGRQRLGRFSRLGHLDGVGGEMTISEVFRVGAAVGFRPDRRDRSPSVDEPTALTYFSGEIAPGKSFNFASTFGLLGSVYQGKPDRLAILVKQSAYLGPKLSFHSTSEVDLHVADPESTSGPRVTVTKLRMVSRITPFLSFEGGVDHHKRPDTRAERELAPDSDAEFVEGTWRYWLKARSRLPGDIELDGEISHVDEPAAVHTARWWRVRLARRGLPLAADSRLTAVVHNLDGLGDGGYGGSLSASIPVLERRLAIGPSLRFRFLEPERTAADFRLLDVSVAADWRNSATWSFHARASYSFTRTGDQRVLDVALQANW